MRLKKIIAVILAAAVLAQGGGFSALAANSLADTLRLTIQSTAQPPAGLPSKYTSKAPAARGQGDDNVGWAFAAVAAIEASGITNGQTTSRDSFSENHMRYALSSDSGNTLGFDRRYTEAGSRRMVTAYLMRDNLSGPISNSADPYVAGAGKLARPLSETASKKRDIRVTGVIYLPDATGGTTELALGRIKAHVRDYGAVAATIYYDESAYQSSGFYHYSGDKTADHAVAIVGWDDSHSYSYTDDEGDTHSGRGAFRVTDSEGSSGRTYWLSYDTPLTDAYAIKGLSKELFEVTYGHDMFAPSSTMGYRSNTAWFASVFTVNNNTEALTAVSFFATGENTTVEFYLAEDAADAATALETAAKGTPLKLEGGGYSATFEMPGYYTILLDSPYAVTTKGGKFAVIAKATTAYSMEPIPLQAAESGTAAGLSFISSDGSHWIDTVGNNNSVVCLKAHNIKDIGIPIESIDIVAPTASEGALENGVLHMSTGASLKVGASPNPTSATNIETTRWTVRNPDNTGFVSPDNSASPSDTDVIKFDSSTGRVTAVREGTAFIRVSITAKPTTSPLPSPGGSFETTLEVRVKDVAALELTLDAGEAEITTAQKLRLKATLLPEDTTDKELFWSVAMDRWGTQYPLAPSAEDPYNENRPAATVEAGIVTPLRPGECWVFVRTRDGGAQASCKVIINEIPATGLALNRKLQTISTGTEFTLITQYQPSNASYQDTLWSSDNESVATVNSQGIVYGRSAGNARIYATNRSGQTVFCEVTVTDAPTVVIGINKSATLTVQGFNASDTDVIWEQSSNVTMSAAPISSAGQFSTEQTTGTRLRVTALSEGGTTITAVIRKNSGTSSQPEYTVIGRQSWRIEGVVLLKHMQLKSEYGDVVKKLTLCADPQGALPAESAVLTAEILLPDNATELTYVWSSRNSEIASVEAIQGSSKGNTARITAVGPGTTQITALNYNNGRKVNISVTVKPYPSELKLVSSPEISVKIGKSSAIRTKVSGATGADKAVIYKIEDALGNARPHTPEDPIAVVDIKGRVTAVRSGAVTVTALAKPYGEGALSASVSVICYEPVKGVTLTAGSREILVRGGTNLNVFFDPETPSNTGITFKLSNPDVAEVKRYDFGFAVEGLRPGKTRITVISNDGSKKSTVSIIVK